MGDTGLQTVSLAEVLGKNERQLIDAWTAQQSVTDTFRASGIKAAVLETQLRQLLAALLEAVKSGQVDNLSGAQWNAVHESLGEISATQTKHGASATAIATFVFSLRQPVFEILQRESAKDPENFAKLMWSANELMDKLGLAVTELAMLNREEIISRQQLEMLELSTPVVKLWAGILALPLIGTLDSERTQVVMETLLNEIVSTGAGLAIIDITGVPTVDTKVAQHLMKTVAAAQLMGAECIISGIRPQIASTLVHLGVDLGAIRTKATLADAFEVALGRLKLRVVPAASA